MDWVEQNRSAFRTDRKTANGSLAGSILLDGAGD
jgi:hypothetical protein